MAWDKRRRFGGGWQAEANLPLLFFVDGRSRRRHQSPQRHLGPARRTSYRLAPSPHMGRIELGDAPVLLLDSLARLALCTALCAPAREASDAYPRRPRIQPRPCAGIHRVAQARLLAIGRALHLRQFPDLLPL